MKLVLLDRDGVLNTQEDGEYVTTPEQMQLFSGAGKAVKALNDAGIRVGVVTNQSAIGRGMIDEPTLKKIHEKMTTDILKEGGMIDRIAFCPDAPEHASPMRKPEPGMLIEMLQHYHALPAETFMVGDKIEDMQAAKAAGCKRILVRTGYGAAVEEKGLPEELSPIEVCDDLPAAVAFILEQVS
jgi:D-glycero-D-manno-heptose 1,7-bisphosphate phosphatase